MSAGNAHSVAARWVLWYLITVVTMCGLTPGVGASFTWQDVTFPVTTLVLGAYFIARAGARAYLLFLYGFAGTLLFVPRFLLMDHFPDWVRDAGDSDAGIVGLWILSMLAGGVVSVAVRAFVAARGP